MNHFHLKPSFPRERPRRLRPRRGITLNHLIACNISNASRGGQCARLLSEQSSAFDAANRLCFNMGAHLTLKSAPGVFSRKTRLQLRYSRARLKNIVRLSVGNRDSEAPHEAMLQSISSGHQHRSPSVKYRLTKYRVSEGDARWHREPNLRHRDVRVSHLPASAPYSRLELEKPIAPAPRSMRYAGSAVMPGFWAFRRAATHIHSVAPAQYVTSKISARVSDLRTQQRSGVAGPPTSWKTPLYFRSFRSSRFILISTTYDLPSACSESVRQSSFCRYRKELMGKTGSVALCAVASDACHFGIFIQPSSQVFFSPLMLILPFYLPWFLGLLKRLLFHTRWGWKCMEKGNSTIKR